MTDATILDVSVSRGSVLLTRPYAVQEKPVELIIDRAETAEITCGVDVAPECVTANHCAVMLVCSTI